MSKIVNILFLLACSTFEYSAGDFNICQSNNSKKAVTLSGPMEGICYDVPLKYSNNSQINKNVFAWLSVPYAEPPIGPNRFLKPKPIQPWNMTKSFKNLPPLCIQSYRDKGRISEDCLFLNIYAQ